MVYVLIVHILYVTYNIVQLYVQNVKDKQYYKNK